MHGQQNIKILLICQVTLHTCRLTSHYENRRELHAIEPSGVIY